MRTEFKCAQCHNLYPRSGSYEIEMDGVLYSLTIPYLVPISDRTLTLGRVCLSCLKRIIIFAREVN